MENKPIKGYKAFDKDLKCKGFQYEIGKEYECDKVKLCKEGFHFCLNPLDILTYYDAAESRFCEIEAFGKIVGRKNDTKKATTKIKIGAELSLKSFIGAAIKFMSAECKYYSKQAAAKVNSNQATAGTRSKQATAGDYSSQVAAGMLSKQATAGGYSSQVAAGKFGSQAMAGLCGSQVATGDSSVQVSSGGYNKLKTTGQDCVMAGVGKDNTARGKKGSWIVLAEWTHDKKKEAWIPACVKSAQIDGEVIKEDTWYHLKGSEFVVSKGGENQDEN